MTETAVARTEDTELREHAVNLSTVVAQELEGVLGASHPDLERLRHTLSPNMFMEHLLVIRGNQPRNNG